MVINSDISQTSISFGDKWKHEYSKNMYMNITDDRLEKLRIRFFAIFGVNDIKELDEIFSDGKKCLNAGCGVAWAEYLFNVNENVTRYAIDYSDSVEVAKELTKGMNNVIISKEDIFDLPFDNEFFDIIFADGVIHHTGDARRAFKLLCDCLKNEGIIGVYVYKTKELIRRIVDRGLREITTNMTHEECMKFSRDIMLFGMALQNISEKVEISEDLDSLGIKSGIYTLQSLLYDYVIKCYYNSAWGSDFSTIVNLDWYHPKNVSFHDIKEITKWFSENHILDIKIIQPEGWGNSGYFVSGRKKL